MKFGKSGDKEMRTVGSCQANSERSSVAGKDLETPELPRDKNRLQSVKLVVNDSNSSLSANEDQIKWHKSPEPKIRLSNL